MTRSMFWGFDGGNERKAELEIQGGGMWGVISITRTESCGPTFLIRIHQPPCTPCFRDTLEPGAGRDCDRINTRAVPSVQRRTAEVWTRASSGFVMESMAGRGRDRISFRMRWGNRLRTTYGEGRMQSCFHLVNRILRYQDRGCVLHELLEV